MGTSVDNASVRDNAIDGSIKTNILNRGEGVGPIGGTEYTRFQLKVMEKLLSILLLQIMIEEVESITIFESGSNYTFGTVDLSAGLVPEGTVNPEFDVIMSTRRTWCRYLQRTWSV